MADYFQYSKQSPVALQQMTNQLDFVMSNLFSKYLVDFYIREQFIVNYR